MNMNRQSTRLLSLDWLRGLIIVLMALDHANHFIAQQHSSGEYWGGPLPMYADALAFLTRLVTHLAAPGFFFLMGAGMILLVEARRKIGWSKWAITRYFLIRGALLIALKFLIVNRAWEWSPGGWDLQTYIGVLFALGGVMIIGSGLVWLKPSYLLALTIVLVVGLALLVPPSSQWGQIRSIAVKDVFNLLFIYPGGTLELWSNYPILPWLEFMTFGMMFGYWLIADSARAFTRALYLGVALLVLFIVVRGLNGFGNIRPRAGSTWIDFLNVVKYPPSIAFALLTMGINLIILAVFAKVSGRTRRWLQPLAVFGQAPLFFYILHLFVYAALGHLLTPHGTSIAAMYPYWLLGPLILFPLTWWYGRFKRRQPVASIWRFF